MPPTTAWPTLAYNVGFSNNPMDVSPTWVDLQAAKDVETLTIARGRQTEDDQAQTGTCAATLGDQSRKYDPNNAASPYFPNVQPMKPVQVVFTLAGTPFIFHTGWVDIQDGWVRDESDPGNVVVSVPSNDGFELLAVGRLINQSTSAHHGGITSTGLGAHFDAEQTGDRIKHVLGGHLTGSFFPFTYDGMDPAWPFSLAGVATGVEPMPAITDPTTIQDAAPLDLVRNAETTEPGLFFFDGTNNPIFLDRHYRVLATSQATFCDGPNISAGRIPYESVTTRRTALVNDARTTRDGGTIQQIQDDDSIDDFGRRAKSWSTQHVDDAHAAAFNEYQLNIHKTSYEQLESLTLVPGTDYATWLQILSREVGDRITVIRRPQRTGATITEDYFIEGLSLTWGPGASASCTWRLSPAPAYQAWLAGTVGSSEAGTTTRAVY